MTTQTARSGTAPAPATPDETQLAQYLEQHPEFFERHAATLARLRLPHVRGGATVSLIERQVEVLREKHEQLEARLAEFVRVARANDQLAERIHRFTRRLLRATSLGETLDQIESGLREDFDASLTRLVLTIPGPLPDTGKERFLLALSREDAALKGFESLFASGKPRCGQIRDSQKELLFGGETDAVASVALLPLGDHGSIGLLAIASADAQRFHPGMSTEFLARMTELIADAIQRHR